MAKKASPRQPSADRILDAALDLAAETRWRDVTMEQVARESGASLQRVHDLFPTKTAFVSAFMRRTTEAVLADHDFGDAAEPVRERLLDVLMRRFDALGPRKAAIRSILRDAGNDPMATLCTAPAFLESMAWSLEAAGLGASGPMGALRLKGLSVIYLSAMRTWLRDDTEDLSPTMAHLDRSLTRADTLMQRLPFCRLPRRRPEERNANV